MNQEDEAAEPMYGAFTDRPDFAPYNVQPEQIPLKLGAPGDPSTFGTPAANATAAQRKAFKPQGEVPANMRSVYEAWQAWRTARSPSTTSMVRTASTRRS